MKRYTASATATGKTIQDSLRTTAQHRWFRTKDQSAPATDTLFDLYWGGPERRITGITVRIIGVNTLALITLMLGILYMGQYQSSIIRARLDTFQSETDLIVAALSEIAGKTPVSDEALKNGLGPLVKNLSLASGQRLSIFNAQGQRLLNSQTMPNAPDTLPLGIRSVRKNLTSIQTLKKMAGFVLELTPNRQMFAQYPSVNSEQAKDYPDVQDALNGEMNLSVWQGNDSKILLTASAPLLKSGSVIGAVLLERPGHDIEQDIAQIWLNVLSVFALTLILTVLLSIYLSGVLARPLKKLARAAEAVRKGLARADALPDFSDRHDEIGELSLALRQMTEALWERMDSIEQFAADVAHELKNPLTSLRSAVETAAIVKTPQDREKLMGIIRHDVDRLDRLITDISNASRLDAELSREHFEPVDLKALLTGLLQTYQDPRQRETAPNSFAQKQQHFLQKDGIVFTLGAASDERLEVWGAQQRIGQVFQNLIANALSFSPPGGTISIFMIPLKQRISVTIEDQGPGIPEAKRETIFERFYSERPQHEDFGQHSGLGLSICRQIVESHGGQIFAENIKEPDGTIKGARFTVVLNRA